MKRATLSRAQMKSGQKKQSKEIFLMKIEWKSNAPSIFILHYVGYVPKYQLAFYTW